MRPVRLPDGNSDERRSQPDDQMAPRCQNHASTGTSIMLFARRRSGERAFYSLGPAEYVSTNLSFRWLPLADCGTVAGRSFWSVRGVSCVGTAREWLTDQYASRHGHGCGNAPVIAALGVAEADHRASRMPRCRFRVSSREPEVARKAVPCTASGSPQRSL